MSNIPTDPNAVPTTAMPIPGVMTPQMMAMYGYQYPGGYMPAPAMPAMPMPVAPRPVIPSTAAALLGISTPSTTSNSSIPSMPMPPMAFPRPAMLQQTLSGLPPAMPTMPTMHTMPGMAGMMPGMMPGGVLPHHPTVPTSVARTMNDPNNDVTCWVEYQTDDQVKYWYNKVTQTSTYDKPFCLKTPEERSIQPCSWKEYKTAEGKSYYSNGQDTRWEIPDEYRIWKEQMDEIEKKKKSGGSQSMPALKRVESNPTLPQNNNNNSNQNNYQSSTTTGISQGNKATSQTTKDNQKVVNTVVYATAAEAIEAFKQLLTDKHISTLAKMKEVQDHCSHDPRWEALKTTGEKKQALAEYQTKKLKQEKEELKQKQRKHKDAFLIMLAENIRIDSRTRWRDAIVFLRDDIRYKNIEDMSEREELFQDFIKELEKKEREDRMKRKELAMESLTNMLKVMQQEQRVSLKTTWLDIKSTLLDLIHERHDLKGLDEIDAKRCLTEYLKVLQEEQRIESNRKKEAFQQEVSVALEQFKEVLEGLRQKHELTAFTRWKDILSRVDVTTSSAFVTLYDLMVKQQTTSQQMQQVGAGSNVQQASGGFGTDIGVAPAAGGAGGSQPFATNNVNMNVEKAEEEFYHKLRQVFDEVITKAQEIYKADKKLLKKCLHEMNYLVQHDSKYEDFKSFVCKFGKVREMEVNGVLQMVAIVEKEVAEEGEEVEEEQDSKQATGATEAAASSSSAAIVEQHVTSAQIQEVLLTRANIHLYEIFIDFHEKAKEYYEEEQRYRLKAEGRFIDMLQDHFYLSDHVHITWEEAKPILSRRSAYEAVEHKSDRKRLFHQYMMSLKEKMEAKSMSMKAYSRELEPGEYEDVPLPPNAAQQASSSSYYDNKKRERSISTDYDYKKRRY